MGILSSSRGLMQEHMEQRVYVSEITYSRNDDPLNLFIFLTEYNTEINCSVERCIRKKRLRSRNETLFWITLSNHDTLLLFVDHSRGNDYIYCTKQVYGRICDRLHNSPSTISHIQPMTLERSVTSLIQLPISLPAPTDLAVFDASATTAKIVFIDSRTLYYKPELIQQLIQNNELIFSPYIVSDLEAIGMSENNLEQLRNTTELLTELQSKYPHRLEMNMYIDSNRYPGVDISTEGEYLFALARQQDLTPSQIVFLSSDESFAMRMRIHDFKAYYLDVSSTNMESIIEISHSLPPRSQRSKMNKPNLWSDMLRSFKSFFI